MKTVVLFLCMLCAFLSIASEKTMANEEACTYLEFSTGFEKNRVMDFLQSMHKAHREKIEPSDFYSAAYDLNGDGIDEYFYYIEHYLFCGMSTTRTGCKLMPYENKGTRFRKLMKNGIFHPGYTQASPMTNPRNYMCILDIKDGPWQRFRLYRQFIYMGEQSKYQLELKYVDGSYTPIIKQESINE